MHAIFVWPLCGVLRDSIYNSNENGEPLRLTVTGKAVY